MGRIGAGEFGTMLFGVMGPLLHLALTFGLLFWGRSLMRRGKGILATSGFYAAVTALCAPLLGLVATVIGLVWAFSGLEGIDPSNRASVLSDGITVAMWGTAIGIVLSMVLYVASFVLLVLATRIPDTTTRAAP